MQRNITLEVSVLYKPLTKMSSWHTCSVWTKWTHTYQKEQLHKTRWNWLVDCYSLIAELRFWTTRGFEAQDYVFMEKVRGFQRAATTHDHCLKWPPLQREYTNPFKPTHDFKRRKGLLLVDSNPSNTAQTFNMIRLHEEQAHVCHSSHKCNAESLRRTEFKNWSVQEAGILLMSMPIRTVTISESRMISLQHQDLRIEDQIYYLSITTASNVRTQDSETGHNCINQPRTGKGWIIEQYEHM